MKIEEVLSARDIIYSAPEIKNAIPVLVGSRAPLQTLFDNREEDS
jgi:hypothetical protein